MHYMITRFKNIARKSEKLRKSRRRVLFFGKMLLHDIKSPRKMFLFWKVLPYTMVSYEALSASYKLAQSVELKKLRGAFVECGVWKGGVSGVLAQVAHAAHSKRQVWLFDSFEGLPEPGKEDGARAKEYAEGKSSGTLSTIGKCVGPLEDVQRLFSSVLNISGEHIHIGKGWFQDTLPKTKEGIGAIAILRLDGDWYESTKVPLDYLFDNVVSGGYVILDDYYCWEGCKKAVDEFCQQRGITPNIVRVDRESAYFQKA
jgi:O-methyltransferase